jgi:hypothetical protein
MTDHAVHRRQMRILGALLTGLWAGIAIAVASAYRPGGPIDLAVALVCFLPVLVADAGVVWPAVGSTRVARVALVWAWVAADRAFFGGVPLRSTVVPCRLGPCMACVCNAVAGRSWLAATDVCPR